MQSDTAPSPTSVPGAIAVRQATGAQAADAAQDSCATDTGTDTSTDTDTGTGPPPPPPPPAGCGTIELDMYNWDNDAKVDLEVLYDQSEMPDAPAIKSARGTVGLITARTRMSGMDREFTPFKLANQQVDIKVIEDGTIAAGGLVIDLEKYADPRFLLPAIVHAYVDSFVVYRTDGSICKLNFDLGRDLTKWPLRIVGAKYQNTSATFTYRTVGGLPCATANVSIWPPREDGWTFIQVSVAAGTGLPGDKTTIASIEWEFDAWSSMNEPETQGPRIALLVPPSAKWDNLAYSKSWFDTTFWYKVGPYGTMHVHFPKLGIVAAGGPCVAAAAVGEPLSRIVGWASKDMEPQELDLVE